MKSRPIDPDRAAHIALYDYRKNISNEFPIDIKKLIFFTSQFDEYPVSEIKNVDYKDFNAGLFFLPNKQSWVILYNKNSSLARQNFSLAQEFGHYLMHTSTEKEFKCNISDTEFLSNKYQKQEMEADSFASALLIPDTDFLEFIKGKKLSKNLFSECATNFNVSLTVVLLKWIKITFLNAVIIFSSDNKILWSRSSNNAYLKGYFYKSGIDLCSAEDVLLENNFKTFNFSQDTDGLKIKVFFVSKI